LTLSNLGEKINKIMISTFKIQATPYLVSLGPTDIDRLAKLKRVMNYSIANRRAETTKKYTA